ncbi:MAG: permease [Flavobacteriales bacterium]|nr:permease [Flavobacteriales bacterium]
MGKLNELLSWLADYLVYDLFSMESNEVFAKSLHYFIVGFSEIIILIILITYLMGIVTSYLNMDKIRQFLEKHKKSGLGYLLASLLGAITPFCSCSSIPMFVGMMQARIPLGMALSFLITSPLVNEIAIAIFFTSFGWKVTIIYIITGVILGVVGGIFLEKIGMSEHVADWVKNLNSSNTHNAADRRSFKERLPGINSEALKTLKKLIPYVFIGLAIGSFIHGYVPQEFFEKYISKSNPFAVPVAVIVSIPLYIDAVGILPILESLVDKGVPLGTAIAFMMGSIGLSLPEALLLKKVMKRKLIVAFFSTIAMGMILSGFVFNLLF